MTAGPITLGPESVTVVVPLHNGRELIERCLASIPAGAEVILVDDRSTDGAPGLVEQSFPRVLVLRNEHNVGFGATANRGLYAARRPVRVVLNSDAWFTPGSLEALLRAFDDPHVGIAGPRLSFPDGSHQVSAAAFPRPASLLAGSFLVNELYRSVRPHRRFRWELGLARRDHATDRDVDWVEGTCLAIRAECLADVTGFDEDYFMYAEETDLCWRARRAGWTVRYVAESAVTHRGGGSTSNLRARAERKLRSEARFMVRAHGPRALPRWRAVRIVGSAVKVVAFAGVGLVDRRARARCRWQFAALRCALGTSWRPDLPLGGPRFSHRAEGVDTLPTSLSEQE